MADEYEAELTLMLRFRFSGGRFKLLESTVRQAVDQKAETIVAAGSTPQPNMDPVELVLRDEPDSAKLRLERLAKFGLELHADKTRLIEFGRFAAQNRKQRGEGKPETFTFLGFTHFCGRTTRTGAFTVWRITAKKRMVAKLKAIKAELQRRKHDRTRETGAWLRSVVLGYYQYHAVPGNSAQLRIFWRRACRLWRSVLVRRSQPALLGQQIDGWRVCWLGDWGKDRPGSSPD
jgi:hypothetical protein